MSYLSGVTVLDETATGRMGSIAGAYCAKLLADAGATVLRLDSGHRDPLRRRGSGALHEYLTAGSSIVEAQPLAEGTDIVLTHDAARVAGRRADHPQLVVATITPFGATGPWADHRATEPTLQAWCGSMGHRGWPDEPPIAAGGELGEWVTGTYAAVGALAALIEARRSGEGEHVDVAMLDCMAVSMQTFAPLFAQLSGWPPLVGTGRTIEVPSIEPTADGYVVFTTNSAQQLHDLCLLIGRPEWGTDPELTRAVGRFTRRDEFLTAVHAYSRARSTEQVLAEAGELRIPCAPVFEPSDVANFEHFVERGVFVPSASGRFRQPRVPYIITPSATSVATDEAQRPAGWQRPLTGMRVLDCTAWWAGPAAAQALGFLGADVIKVESTGHPDLMRTATVRPGDPQWLEWGPLFHGANSSKRGLDCDLASPAGIATFHRLLATADVLIENFTPRVMDQFGLTWDEVSAINPAIVMTRMPAFGLDGPWRDRTGFAQTMESVTGMAARTGQPGGPPVLVRGAGDPLAAMHATFATLVGLFNRRQTGRGCHIEAVMVEAALNAAAEAIIDPSSVPPRGVLPGHRLINHGNDSWSMVTGDGIAAPVIAARDVGDNPQLIHRGLFETIDHPVAGRFTAPGLPMRMSRVHRWTTRPAPTLGQHTAEILAELDAESPVSARPGI